MATKTRTEIMVVSERVGRLKELIAIDRNQIEHTMAAPMRIPLIPATLYPKTMLKTRTKP